MTAIWAETALLPTGWATRVAVTPDGPRIGAVAAGVEPAAGALRVGCLLPAPANLHSHAFQRAMAGLSEARGPDPQDTFWTWRRLMFRFLDRLTPDDIEAIAALVQVEMLEAGFAAVAEFHYLHHAPGGAPYADPAETSHRIAAAAAQTGIGLTLLPVLYQQGGCDGRPLAPGQVRFGSTPDGFARLVEGAGAALAALPGDARLGVAPHSLRAVSPAGRAVATALRPGAPVHIHAAEQTAEVDEVTAHLGARPVEWLLAEAGAGDGWCLIHCTQMTAAETRALAASGAVAGLCPVTEASLGDGIFDGVAYTRAGGLWGVGSDSNIRIGLTGELRQFEYSQRLRDRARALLARPDASTGRALWDGACAGGAAASGRAAGAIAPGMLADLVALDTAGSDLAGLAGDTILDTLVFATGDAPVAEVWAAGRHVVRGGRHVAGDAVRAAWARVRDRLRADV